VLLLQKLEKKMYKTTSLFLMVAVMVVTIEDIFSALTRNKPPAKSATPQYAPPSNPLCKTARNGSISKAFGLLHIWIIGPNPTVPARCSALLHVFSFYVTFHFRLSFHCFGFSLLKSKLFSISLMFSIN